MFKYLNPYTDFGFKKLFGEEGSKDLLMDFLNQLLPSHHQIAGLQFRNVEQLPDRAAERRAIVDTFCTSISGERFIVEIQKARLDFFKDRSLFYATFPIREQVEKGIWPYRLTPVYLIAILDFEYDKLDRERKFLRKVALRDRDGHLFSDKLHFIFLQMPLFNKQEHELETRIDKWVYLLKNLGGFDHIPAVLNEPLFRKAFEVTESAALSREQYAAYQQHLLDYRTTKAAFETARREGFEEGIKEGREEGRKARVIRR